MERCGSLRYNGKRHLPLPSGPYTVGCTDIMTSYSRAGVFIRLYYPAAEIGAEEHYLEWTPWIANKEYIDGYAFRAGISQTLFRCLHYFLVGDVYIPAIWEAVISQDKTFPVVIFSHGLASCRSSYSSVCLELASHGFIVASMEHRDGTACATFYMKPCRMSSCGEFPGSSLSNLDDILKTASDEEWESAKKGEWEPEIDAQKIAPPSYTKEWMYYRKIDPEEQTKIRGNQVKKRAQECIQALDLLHSLNRGSEVINVLDSNFQAKRFMGTMDLSRVAAMGHSFGGATAILSLAMDSRFKLGISMDPWMVPLEDHKTVYSSITQPLLVVSTDGFQDDASKCALKTLIREDVERSFLTIKKAQHRDQSDIPFIGNFLFSYLLGNSSMDVGYMTLVLSTQMTLDFLKRNFGLPLSENTIEDDFKKHLVIEFTEQNSKSEETTVTT